MARNVSWIFIGQGANFVMQAAYFVLLARLLGVTEYGVFAGAFALVNTVSPYSSLGSGMIFMRYVSEDRTMAPVYWGNTLAITTASTGAIALVLCFVGPSVTGVRSPLMFLMLTLANCLFGQITLLGSKVFQTFEHMKRTAALAFVANLSRFLAVVSLVLLLHHATALQWSVGILISSMLAAIASLWWVHREVRGLEVNFALVRRRSVEGLGYSVAGTAAAVYNDIDKTMLSHYGMNYENGFYTLAYRLVDFTTTPVSSIDVALLPKFFQMGRSDLMGVRRLALKSLRISVPLGLAIAVATLLLAPVVPKLVGRDYSGALTAIRWLCWLPLFRGIHTITGSALTGSGHQTIRTVFQFVVAGINLAMNFILIPRVGWVAAAWASVLSDGLLAVLGVAFLLWVTRSSNTSLPGNSFPEGSVSIDVAMNQERAKIEDEHGLGASDLGGIDI